MLSRREFLQRVVSCSALTLGALSQTYPVAVAQTPDPSLRHTDLQKPQADSPARASAPGAEQTETIRQYADVLGIKFGSLGEAGGPDPDQRRLMLDQMNHLTVATIYWSSTQPAPDAYDFKVPDFFVGLGNQNGMSITAQHLVWGFEGSTTEADRNLEGFIPRWLAQGGYSKDELINIMQQRIRTVMTRYTGKVTSYVVVNEATVREPYNFWRRETGGLDYVDIAFRTARESDPSAKLIYNDTKIEWDGGMNANEAFTIVQRLALNGLIDGIGMQYHVRRSPNMDPNNLPTKEQLLEQMKKFYDLGLSIYLTELDVDIRSVPGTTEEKLQRQADIYRTVVETVLESGGMCRSICVWGMNDESSWLKDGMPLLFSKNQPKPSYFAVLNALKTAVTSS